jgi:hypothetical protein
MDIFLKNAQIWIFPNPESTLYTLRQNIRMWRGTERRSVDFYMYFCFLNQ